MRRIFSFLRPYRRQALLVLSSIIFAALCGAMPPLFLKRIVDQAIPEGRVGLLFLLCGGMALGPLLAGLLGVAQRYLAAFIAERVMFDLRVQLFRHVQRQSLGYFANAKSGEVVSRVLNDVQGVGHMMQENLVKLLQNAMVFAVSSAVIFSLDWRLALVAFAPAAGVHLPGPQGGADPQDAQAARAGADGGDDRDPDGDAVRVGRAAAQGVRHREEGDQAPQGEGARADGDLAAPQPGRPLVPDADEAVRGARPRDGVGGGRLAGRARRHEARHHRRVRRAAAEALRAGVGPGRRARRRRHVVRVLRSHLRRAGPRAGHPQRARRDQAARDRRAPSRSGACRSRTGPTSRCCATSTSTSRRANASRSSGRRARARARWRRWCRGCTTRTPARSWSTATTSAPCASSRCASHIGVVTQETYLFHASILDNLRYARPDADAGGGGAGRARRADPRLHHRPARRIRDDRRRARLPSVGRRAAAARHRARAAQGPEDPDPRRGDELARLDQRGADPGGARSPAGRADEPDRRAPPRHHPQGQPDRRARARAHRRDRRPRRAAGPGGLYATLYRQQFGVGARETAS